MISIIVVHYGDLWDITNNALRTLTKHAAGDHEIICVCNASDLPFTRKSYPSVNYQRIPKCSYASAVNFGARWAEGDQLLILNNDITMSGKYLHLIGEHALEGQKIMTLRGGYIEGWCLSVDHGLWNLLNGFDEQLRNSWEDVDFSQRAHKLGYAYHQLKLPISHTWGATRNVTEGANQWDQSNERTYRQKAERIAGLVIPFGGHNVASS